MGTYFPIGYQSTLFGFPDVYLFGAAALIICIFMGLIKKIWLPLAIAGSVVSTGLYLWGFGTLLSIFVLMVACYGQRAVYDLKKPHSSSWRKAGSVLALTLFLSMWLYFLVLSSTPSYEVTAQGLIVRATGRHKGETDLVPWNAFRVVPDEFGRSRIKGGRWEFFPNEDMRFWHNGRPVEGSVFIHEVQARIPRLTAARQ